MVWNLLAQGAMKAAPYALDAAAFLAPTVVDAMLSAPPPKPVKRPFGSRYSNAPSDDMEGEAGGPQHPILDLAAGAGLAFLAHKGMKAFPKMRAKGEPPPVNDPAKATPAASQPVNFTIEGDVVPTRRSRGIGFSPMTREEIARQQAMRDTKEQLARGERGMVPYEKQTTPVMKMTQEELDEIRAGEMHNAAEELGEGIHKGAGITSPFPIEYNPPKRLGYEPLVGSPPAAMPMNGREDFRRWLAAETRAEPRGFRTIRQRPGLPYDPESDIALQMRMHPDMGG